MRDFDDGLKARNVLKRTPFQRSQEPVTEFGRRLVPRTTTETPAISSIIEQVNIISIFYVILCPTGAGNRK